MFVVELIQALDMPHIHVVDQNSFVLVFLRTANLCELVIVCCYLVVRVLQFLIFNFFFLLWRNDIKKFEGGFHIFFGFEFLVFDFEFFADKQDSDFEQPIDQSFQLLGQYLDDSSALSF